MRNLATFEHIIAHHNHAAAFGTDARVYRGSSIELTHILPAVTICRPRMRLTQNMVHTSEKVEMFGGKYIQ